MFDACIKKFDVPPIYSSSYLINTSSFLKSEQHLVLQKSTRFSLRIADQIAKTRPVKLGQTESRRADQNAILFKKLHGKSRNADNLSKDQKKTTQDFPLAATDTNQHTTTI